MKNVMNIDDVKVVDISECRNRVVRLIYIGGNSHPHTKLLDAIYMSGKNLQTAKDLAELESGDSQDSVLISMALDSEAKTQATLAHHGITSKDSAIASIDIVEPVIRQWTAQYEELQALQAKEMVEFFEGLQG